jgi:hypothetical protein
MAILLLAGFVAIILGTLILIQPCWLWLHSRWQSVPFLTANTGALGVLMLTKGNDSSGLFTDFGVRIAGLYIVVLWALLGWFTFTGWWRWPWANWTADESSVNGQFDAVPQESRAMIARRAEGGSAHLPASSKQALQFDQDRNHDITLTEFREALWAQQYLIAERLSDLRSERASMGEELYVFQVMHAESEQAEILLAIEWVENEECKAGQKKAPRRATGD